MNMHKVIKYLAVANGFIFAGAPGATGAAFLVPDDLSRPSGKRIIAGALSVAAWFVAFKAYQEYMDGKHAESVDAMHERINAIREQNRDLSVLLNPDERLELVRDTDGRLTQGA